MDLETLLRLLGVSNATEAGLAIERMNSMLQELQRLTGQQSSAGIVQSVQALVTALGGTGPEALARLQGMQTALQRVPELEQEIATMRRAGEDRDAEQLMREASEDGRLTPAARETAQGFYRDNGLAALRAFLSVLPRSSIASPAPRQRATSTTSNPQATASDDELTPAERRVAELMGQTPEQALEGKRLWTQGADARGEVRLSLAELTRLDAQVLSRRAPGR